MNFTPDLNNGSRVFVFGSNEAGLHHGGAAREARQHWGAVMNCGVGYFGQSYALPTMDGDFRPLPIEKVAEYVSQFIRFSTENPQLEFLVTKIGCGIAGFHESEIAPLFAEAPNNCILPDEFKL